MESDQETFVMAVLAEREYQKAKWGANELNHNQGEWLAILNGELGEYGMAMIGEASENERHTMRSELVQIAAVCLAAFESGIKWDWLD